MIMNIKRYFRHSTHHAAFAITVLAGLTLGSCAEEDLGNRNGGDKGTAVTFNVSSAQDDAQAAAAKAMPGMPVTRAAFCEQLGMMNLTPENLTSQKLAVQGAADLCLIETTTAGIDEMPRPATKDAPTRANITTLPNLGHFSSYGYRGTTATSFSATPDWFYGKDTNPDGTLVDPVYWAWDKNHFGRFYAVYPQVTNAYTKLTISPENHASTPYVDFEVESDVKNQKDLMTACSGVVHYATQFVAPTTNLKFRHALTAVRFKVGQNLSWNKEITKVEILGAKSKGRYTLATDENGTNAAWSNLDAPKTFTLGGDGTVNVSTSEAVNNIIMGNAGDNYTFYMIPQSLAGVQVKVYFDNNTTPAITANLAGTWKPGTTKTYALSQNTSTWNYTLNVTSPTAAEYDATTTGNYKIESYRKDPVTHTLQPVKWKVIGYDTDGDGTFSISEPWPSWFKGISKTSGNGSIGATGETGTATLTRGAVVDKLAQMNAAMKLNPKGGSTDYYDLSIHNVKGAIVPRSTANCYVISHPGYYKIPLVYGNAITNGVNNTNSYETSNSGTKILTNFKDHNDQNITDPWIEKTNSGANNGVDGAKLVWADTPNLVHFGSNKIVRSGGETFVQFEVKASDIQNGNAVIAVTKGGTVVWSWHLWFAPEDFLNTVTCTNFQNKEYKFTQKTLGMKYTAWTSTAYTAPRSIKVKVEQETPNGGVRQESVITITQNPGDGERQGFANFYQFGRKDALPGTDAIAEGNYAFATGINGRSLGSGIQHPENMFWYIGHSFDNGDWCNITYYNLWSANNTTTGYNDAPVVKTVYDPCPAGFKMPASNAFTGFTTDGKSGYHLNTTGTWSNGHTFNNKIAAPDASIYFPALGWRYSWDGSLMFMGERGYYWTAVPYGENTERRACHLYFHEWGITPLDFKGRSFGCSVRPVAE
ncbi:MAG: fimbrillin family protein [Segatella oris]|uniref:fimbrillin family protein n=1 Tax=Segatella oris TaxID=28135 RepID=UPI003FA26096